jgi:hypothetical protein
MNDIIAMHRADLVNAVTEAVKPLKRRIDELEARLANGLKLFEDFYWPPPEDAPEEAQRIRDIIAALKGTQS